ncbi:hypothetical protein NNJEOMEG_03763 [Fundidesulfovibrio magnetotacticus]|uniref:Chromate resistance protein n=1 Tax=Fundidesulfovibrio magnetotacticus TaxID=2730080 RepID=A0A6V8LYL1_9BACT|nr:chromate resistance protein ChrB domain-containing protein [Fundidesulfovibrio magnetotacticus]GFK95890.1 hypothetical protein NNJEOMEG_03763 [Fundidesulfovibrio magnetotacticus]
MNNISWLYFSFTLPAKNQAGRMRVWRRLGGLGAVIARGALYVLPRRDGLREQLVWLAKEVEDLGGEALLLESGAPANLESPDLEELFTKARDADWLAIEEEVLPLMDRLRGAGGEAPDALTPQAQAQALRKIARRAEALAAVDYFPGPRGPRVRTLLNELAALAAPGAPAPAHGVPLRDPADFRGLEWVTRENPYVDRLASFWLVRRFVDPGARLRFAPEDQPCPPSPGTARFDMDQAEFTHTGPLTTFETLCAAFSLEARVPALLREIIRAIDLDLEAGPPEALGVKRVLDGLCRLPGDDFERMRRASDLFDALLAATETPKGE